MLGCRAAREDFRTRLWSSPEPVLPFSHGRARRQSRRSSALGPPDGMPGPGFKRNSLESATFMPAPPGFPRASGEFSAVHTRRLSAEHGRASGEYMALPGLLRIKDSAAEHTVVGDEEPATPPDANGTDGITIISRQNTTDQLVRC